MPQPSSATVEVRVTLPPEVASALGEANEDRAARVQEAVVVDLYRTAKLSCGRAAELLGVNLHDFIDLLAKHRVPVVDPDEEQEAEDRAAVGAYLEKARRGP